MTTKFIISSTIVITNNLVRYNLKTAIPINLAFRNLFPRYYTRTCMYVTISTKFSALLAQDKS